MKPAPAIATTPDTFDPLAVGLPPKDHNQTANDNDQSAFDAIRQEIDDLFDTAKDFCDGEPIDSDAMAAVITELHDKIHDCGKRAEELRVAEKKPLDDQITAIQTKFHPLIGNTKAGKGKVVLGKEACQALLTPWRTAAAQKKAEEAAAAAAEAEAARRQATEAIRASSGNLAAREEAETLLADAKALERQAGRANKAATTGLGLRTVWRAELVDENAALDWFWGERPDAFRELIQRLADEAVRAGVRKVPGFAVVEEKVAA